MRGLLIYNLFEYSKNYSKTTRNFWKYYRDEPNSGANNNINYSIKDSKSFDCKTSIARNVACNNTEKEVENVVSLIHLSNIWRILNLLLINCEINLILTWSGNCLFTSKVARVADLMQTLQ